MFFNEVKKEKYLASIKKKLLKVKKVKFNSDNNWIKNFKPVSGVYAIFEKERFCFGETRSLSARMKDLQDTRHHTFRRTIGYRLFHKKASSFIRYSKLQEEALNKYFEQNIKISALPLNLGRKEFEEMMVMQHDLYNKKQKR